MNNFAFIDGQNLYSGVRQLGWQVDLFKLRAYLARKYDVTRAYYFIGYMPQNEKLYLTLRNAGYDIELKPVVTGRNHDPKGNVDADLVLKALV